MLSELLQLTLDWVAAHSAYAGIIVFLSAFCESLAFIGIIFPGALLMFGFGALVATGVMDFNATLLWAIAGAITGDVLSFGIGHQFRTQLRSQWPFRAHPELLAQGVEFFQRHGVKSIFFGRFVGPVRPVIPLIAGMLGMSIARFFPVNIIAAFTWAPAYLFPGMVFTASLNLAAEVAARLTIIILIGSAALWLFIIALRYLFQKLYARKILFHILIAILFICVSGIFYFTLHYKQEPIPLLTREEWWADGGRKLPASRSDLRVQPLNLHWAGDLTTIRTRLITAGWRPLPELRAATFMQIIAPHPVVEQLPLFPQLFHGQFDRLRLIFPTSGDGALVIRLWDAQSAPSFPLWIGYLGCLETVRPIPWITLRRSSACFTTAHAILGVTLADLTTQVVERDAGNPILLIK